MKKIKIIISLLITIIIIGCTNLEEVREYTNESKDVRGYIELTENFKDTYSREKNFIIEGKMKAWENDKKRKEAYASLLEVERQMANYMIVLGMLAGEETYIITEDAAKLRDEFKEYPDFKLDKREVEAAINISEIVINWAMYAKQRKAVEEYVKDGNEDIQTILQGMNEILNVYKMTNRNERGIVIGLYDVDGEFIENKVLYGMMQDDKKRKMERYDEVEKKIDITIKQVEKIAEGHQELYDNLEDISKDDVKEMIDLVKDDLKALKAEYKALK